MGKSVASLLDPRTSRKTVITSESPSDTRGSSKDRHSAENEEHQQQSRQTSSKPVRTQGFLENFHEAESSRWCESIINVSDAEQDSDQHTKAKNAVDEHTRHQGLGNGCSGLLDFLAHVDGAISTCMSLACPSSH